MEGRDDIFDDYHGLDTDGSPCDCEKCILEREAKRQMDDESLDGYLELED